jgi:hypothetical protein
MELEKVAKILQILKEVKNTLEEQVIDHPLRVHKEM